MVPSTFTWEELLALDQRQDDRLSEETQKALGDEIVRCEVLQGGALYRQLLCLRLFDAAGGWAALAYRSLEAWLGVNLGWNYKTANERVRVARSLARLPKLDLAFREGVLSYTKVRAIHDIATPENEERLIRQARNVSGEQLRRLVAPMRAQLRRERSRHETREEERGVHFLQHPYHDLVEVRATLHPDEAATFRKALEVGVELGVKSPAATGESAAADPAGQRPTARDEPDAEPNPATGSQSSLANHTDAYSDHESAAADAPTPRFGFADALVLMSESFLAEPPRKGVPAGRRELLIHTIPDLSEGVLEGGGSLGPETVRRLACDGPVVLVERGPDGEVLDVGRRTRRITRRIERALVIRDRCCRFPGCTRTAMLDAHHLEHWADGGKTKLSNLVRLCRFHHRLVHEGNWTVEHRDEARVAFLDPSGEEAAPPGQLPELPATQTLTALEAECRAGGQEFAPDQLRALEGGERIPDYGWTTAVLADLWGFEPEHPGELAPAIRWLQENPPGSPAGAQDGAATSGPSAA